MLYVVLKFVYRISWIILLSIQVACTNQRGSASKVNIQLPSAAELKSAAANVAAATAYDWSTACFVVNVTAADIPSTRPNSCDITFGVAAGSVAPGANLSLTVPAGTGRTADVYIYQRFASTDACPLANQSFAGLDHSRIFKVGSTSSIDTTSTEVDVSIDVSAPAIGASILSQLNLGSNCAPSFQVKGLSVSSSTAFATDQFFKSVLTTGAVSGERRSTNFKLKNTQINF